MPAFGLEGVHQAGARTGDLDQFRARFLGLPASAEQEQDDHRKPLLRTASKAVWGSGSGALTPTSYGSGGAG